MKECTRHLFVDVLFYFNYSNWVRYSSVTKIKSIKILIESIFIEWADKSSLTECLKIMLKSNKINNICGKERGF